MRFVNQFSGLEGVPRFFISHAGAGQFAEFFVDERQQVRCRSVVACCNGLQQLGYI